MYCKGMKINIYCYLIFLLFLIIGKQKVLCQSNIQEKNDRNAYRILEKQKKQAAKTAKKSRKKALKDHMANQTKAVRKSIKRNARRQKKYHRKRKH
jgi:hypothetical protein